MTELRRFAIMLAALGACLAMMTGTALAGGWAEVAMTSDSEDPPTAGEEREIEFSLLQHGVTAVDYGNVKLTAVNPDTGQTITVPATNHGGGVWSATVTFPVEGSWQIGVAHDGLVTPEPTTMLVRPQDGIAAVPGAFALGAFALVAVVVVGSMVVIRRRHPSDGEATASAVRAV